MYPLDEEDEDNLNNKPIKRKKSIYLVKRMKKNIIKIILLIKRKKSLVKVICSLYLTFILYNI